MARKIEGTCHLCGAYGPLSFEHVPPAAAFNNRPVVVRGMMELMETGLDSERGRIQQRGAGRHSLCTTCNNNTGSWYGPSYVEWAVQGLRLLDAAAAAPSLNFTFQIFPLRIIKQIVCMFFSANGPEFRTAQPELVRFVLNRHLCMLPHRIRIYAFLNRERRARSSGPAGTVDLESGTLRTLSEVVFVPFGYVLCIDSPPPDDRLVDITHFGDHGYDDWKDRALRLPLLPIYTAYPGDYRDRDTVLRDAARTSAS